MRTRQVLSLLLGLTVLWSLSFQGRGDDAMSRVAGETRMDAEGVEQVWVPAGTFPMGTDAVPSDVAIPGWARQELESEMPRHEVTLTRGYWLDQYEVTHAAFQAFIDAGGYQNPDYWSESGWRWSRRVLDGGQLPAACLHTESDHPRLCVTWYEADAYARWRGGRLPTEAEWEYAARGPEALHYPDGNDFDPAKANVVDSAGPTPVGAYPEGASWVGAHDLSGNAMEWVDDWLDRDYYKKGVNVDPKGPADGRIKVEKGGWWGSNAYVARAAYRHFEDTRTYQDHHIGFRIVTDGE